MKRVLVVSYDDVWRKKISLSLETKRLHVIQLSDPMLCSLSLEYLKLDGWIFDTEDYSEGQIKTLRTAGRGKGLGRSLLTHSRISEGWDAEVYVLSKQKPYSNIVDVFMNNDLWASKRTSNLDLRKEFSLIH